MEQLNKEIEHMMPKGTAVAITANSGGFRLCELAENLGNTSSEAKVRFYIPAESRYSDNCFYKPIASNIESIDTNLIITPVKMCSLTRMMSKLPDTEIDKITDKINASYSMLKTALPLITENGFDNNFVNKDDFDPNLEQLPYEVPEHLEKEREKEFSQFSFSDGGIVTQVDGLIKNLGSCSSLFEEINSLKDSTMIFESSNKNTSTPNELPKVKVNEKTVEIPTITTNAEIIQTDKSIKELQSNSSLIFSAIGENTASQGGSVYEPSNANTSITEELPKSKKQKIKVIEKPKKIPTNISKRSKEINKSLQTSEKEDNINLQKTNRSSDLINAHEKEKIYFNITSKNDEKKRIYDKRHVCLFCNASITKVTRHLQLKHSGEMEVGKLLALPDDSFERKNGFVELMRQGDFYHNCNVLAIKEGELVLVRRPSEQESLVLTYNDFGPCPGCTGFMLKKHLWHHTRMCVHVKQNKNRNIIQQSNALVHPITHPNITKQFKDNVLDKLIDDSIGKVAKADETIIFFGQMMVEKHDEEQYELTRQSMRQLARFLIALRSTMYSPELNLKNVIKPSNFDEIIVAVRQVSGVKTDTKKIPSLALKLGYHLQKCAGIVRGQALRTGDSETDKSCKDFLDLYSLEWQTKVSSAALNEMNKRKMNSANMIPLTSDLMKLNTFLISELKKLITESETVLMKTETWMRLAKITLCRFITFNKKRGGEAARITIQQYVSKPNWAAENHENFSEHLSSLERELVKKLTLVEITGKRRRVVPVLLTEDVNRAITILINTRETAGVSKYNPFIFARPYNNSLQALRGSDCIREIISTLKLEKPELISSTKLRKYIATISQVFNLHENEVDWLARHLGHDINVHRNFYRIHHSAIELTKVSKLLMAVDKGKANELAGKTLDEINVEDLFGEDEDTDERNNYDTHIDDGNIDDENIDDDVQDEPDNTKDNEYIMDSSAKSPPSPVPKNKALSRKKNKTSSRNLKSISKNNRQTWSIEEKKVVLEFFKDNIKEKGLPGKLQYMKLINNNKRLLGHRHWKKIKDFLRNYKRSIK